MQLFTLTKIWAILKVIVTKKAKKGTDKIKFYQPLFLLKYFSVFHIAIKL